MNIRQSHLKTHIESVYLKVDHFKCIQCHYKGTQNQVLINMKVKYPCNKVKTKLHVNLVCRDMLN